MIPISTTAYRTGPTHGPSCTWLRSQTCARRAKPLSGVGSAAQALRGKGLAYLEAIVAITAAHQAAERDARVRDRLHLLIQQLTCFQSTQDLVGIPLGCRLQPLHGRSLS